MKHNAIEDRDKPRRYEICIRGHLDDKWADTFDGLTMTRDNAGDTHLTGFVTDQAALHGLLRKVRDLGMPLISVVQIESQQINESPIDANTVHTYATKEKTP